jgi:hypothetical protein
LRTVSARDTWFSGRPIVVRLLISREGSIGSPELHHATPFHEEHRQRPCGVYEFRDVNVLIR